MPRTKILVTYRYLFLREIFIALFILGKELYIMACVIRNLRFSSVAISDSCIK
jgi:hypothetical protein